MTLLSAQPALCFEGVVIFRGETQDVQLLALSVPTGSDPAPLRELADRSGDVVLVYQDHAKASSLEPLAIFAGPEAPIFNEAPQRSEKKPTVGDLVKAANVAGPKRLGAVCGDGARVRPLGRSQLIQMAAMWRECSSRGGLGRWYRTSTRDTDAVVATICQDYRLVAGSGDGWGKSGRLVRVRNRKYR